MALMLYPILKQHDARLALGYLAFRIVAVALIGIGVILLLLLLTLSQSFVKSGEPASAHFQTIGDLLRTGRDLVNHMDMTLVLSMGGLLFAYLLYQTKLIPRWLAGWGLAGAAVTIAMGAFAIGMIIGARDFMVAGMEWLWRSSSPAMIYLWNYPSVDDATISVLQHVPGVHAVEGFQQSTVEWRLTPTDPWAAAGLTARDDYTQQQFAKIDIVSG